MFFRFIQQSRFICSQFDQVATVVEKQTKYFSIRLISTESMDQRSTMLSILKNGRAERTLCIFINYYLSNPVTCWMIERN